MARFFYFCYTSICMPTIPTQPISQEFTSDEPRVIEETIDSNPPEPSDLPIDVNPAGTDETSLATAETTPAGAEDSAALPESPGEIEAEGEVMPSAEASAPVTETVEGWRARLHKPKKQPVAVPQVRDKLTVQLEKIMEEGLKDAFQVLTPVQKQEFKIKGEETARKIRDLLRHAHVKVKKIFRLILEWLRLLPGVNRFFLEQEAKIKADKIIALKNMTHDT